jgi:hypothetical protein
MEVKLDQNESPLMRHFRFQVSSGLKVNSMDNYSNGIPASDWIWELSSCLVLLSALTLSKSKKFIGLSQNQSIVTSDCKHTTIVFEVEYM